MISIEFEPPRAADPCDCCGAVMTLLTRFVYRNGDARAIYFAQFAKGHNPKIVVATISIGEWDEHASTNERVAFAMELHANDEQYEVRLLDAKYSPWQASALIGRTLDREEALQHPFVNEMFEITNHIFAEDEPIRTYFASE